ncbi:hypothetical protein AMATHDRAFT_145432 [Amanita thiersii Skay4041]|uniref:AB hydrolase-1 domain-containing protein n=1 Tax=Amanita thiersii Skay4041 TaxID=703135 RepID=A0A2A9NH41_9AGAR|nr:hypothetical protein AMATHDRAFT_145432 [Amanita thiersii Skay4041]
MAPSLPIPPQDISSLPTIFDSATCVRRGLCPVTKIRPQGPEALESHSLYYEQHGRGTKHKVVFIMGLNSSSFSWGPQVAHFGASVPRPAKDKGASSSGDGDVDENEDDYTILVFDNRGVGNSTYPRGPYSTSGMAEDVIALLDYIGWTAERDIHVVGTSLGGMIAQELAYRIPHRIISLAFCVTTPGGYPWNNLPPWAGVHGLAKLTFTPDIDKKAPTVANMLFPSHWLAQRDEDDPKGRTNYHVQSEDYIRRITITKPQQLMGHFSQMIAGLTHYVSPERLRTISGMIPKVLIITGDEDNLVRPINSRRLKESMPEAELLEWPGTGHAIHLQWPKRFNELLEKTFREGRRRVDDGWKPKVSF